MRRALQMPAPVAVSSLLWGREEAGVVERHWHEALTIGARFRFLPGVSVVIRPGLCEAAERGRHAMTDVGKGINNWPDNKNIGFLIGYSVFA